jgi:2-C-methyl-D-erythritol 4-phosphate cytidylyltransferase
MVFASLAAVMGAAVAVVLGAGSGERLGCPEPKAVLDLEGSTLLERAAASARGSRAVGGIVVVVPKGVRGSRSWKRWLDRPLAEVLRQASVLIALRAIGGGAGDVVLLH